MDERQKSWFTSMRSGIDHPGANSVGHPSALICNTWRKNDRWIFAPTSTFYQIIIDHVSYSKGAKNAAVCKNTNHKLKEQIFFHGKLIIDFLWQGKYSAICLWTKPCFRTWLNYRFFSVSYCGAYSNGWFSRHGSNSTPPQGFNALSPLSTWRSTSLGLMTAVLWIVRPHHVSTHAQLSLRSWISPTNCSARAYA